MTTCSGYTRTPTTTYRQTSGCTTTTAPKPTSTTQTSVLSNFQPLSNNVCNNLQTLTGSLLGQLWGSTNSAAPAPSPATSSNTSTTNTANTSGKPSVTISVDRNTADKNVVQYLNGNGQWTNLDPNNPPSQALNATNVRLYNQSQCSVASTANNGVKVSVATDGTITMAFEDRMGSRAPNDYDYNDVTVTIKNPTTKPSPAPVPAPTPNGTIQPTPIPAPTPSPVPNPAPVPTSTSISIQVKGFLQGAFNSSSGLMNDTLRSSGLLPTAQPYTTAGYTGTETLSSSVLATTGNNAPVDWVMIELRDKADPTKIVARQAAVVQRDGDIANAQTNDSLLKFDNVPDGDYFVSLVHRNHLGVMTSTPIALDDNKAASVDFTKANTAYGTNAEFVTNNGTALLWAGDANSSNNVIAAGPNNDTNNVLAAVLMANGNTNANVNYILNGYTTTDLNLDGSTIYAGPNNDTNVILANVLTHPENTTTSTNFIIQGELPTGVTGSFTTGTGSTPTTGTSTTGTGTSTSTTGTGSTPTTGTSTSTTETGSTPTTGTGTSSTTNSQLEALLSSVGGVEGLKSLLITLGMDSTTINNLVTGISNGDTNALNQLLAILMGSSSSTSTTGTGTSTSTTGTGTSTSTTGTGTSTSTTGTGTSTSTTGASTSTNSNSNTTSASAVKVDVQFNASNGDRNLVQYRDSSGQWRNLDTSVTFGSLEAKNIRLFNQTQNTYIAGDSAGAKVTTGANGQVTINFEDRFNSRAYNDNDYNDVKVTINASSTAQTTISTSNFSSSGFVSSNSTVGQGSFTTNTTTNTSSNYGCYGTKPSYYNTFTPAVTTNSFNSCLSWNWWR
ncbi:MAG: hypothetical protein RLZZ422_1621 [Pseudomonadota bacterium]|jgi:hypothetical protein